MLYNIAFAKSGTQRDQQIDYLYCAAFANASDVNSRPHISYKMKEEEQSSSNISTRELIAIGIPCILSWVFTYLAINYFIYYAWGLFIWLPAVLGATSTI